MAFNLLDNTAKRVVSACNFNQHIAAVHPDRVMDEHDLVYIKEGNWSVCQDGVEYELVPGDVILLHSGHHHYGQRVCKTPVKTCFVHFSSSERDEFREDCPRLTGHFRFPVVVHCQNDPLVEHYFNRMIYAYWSGDPYATTKVSAYLQLCLCAISERWEGGAEQSSLVEEIKLLIRKTPDRVLTNGELAAKCCCSVRTLSTKFKEATGESLHAWQVKIKCEMAAELMRTEPTLTLKEIASTYGFCDEYHFGKCYKKRFGCSPKRRK